MKGKTKNKISGFTLIELLVVLFIIGTLTGLLLPNLMSARQRSRDSRRKQDLFEIKTALRLYYSDNQGYPAVLTFNSAWAGYMAFVPDDPKQGQNYAYCDSSDGEGFILAASLENPGDNQIVSSQSRCSTAAICVPVPECTTNCYFVCAD